MSVASRLRSWTRVLLRRSQMEADMNAELRFHVEAYAEDLARRGVPRQEAARRARVEFGGIERVKEECREALGTRLLGEFIADVRYGLRQLRRNPGFTAVAVLTLALGIAANSTIFGWINSTILDPIPGVSHTSDLVSVMRGVRSEHPTPPFSYLDYRDLRDSNHSFSGLLAFHQDFMYLT